MHLALPFGLFCFVATLGAQESTPAPRPVPQGQNPVKVPTAQPEAPPAAQPAAPQEAAPPMPADKMEQLVAPIALYPDALLAQLLMASTYPIEIVEAARWVQKNGKMTVEKLEAALKDQDWDPSVKSLCAVPDVLKRMNENLDWTQDLGDAFLSNKAQLMETVQTMRRKAYDAGTLKSGAELQVTKQEDQIIVIQSAKPEVIYVPTYYPTAVYGAWSYPTYYYPPMYPAYPPGGMFLSFTAGMVWGAAIWGDCNWGHSDVDIDINRQNNFIDNTDRDGSRKQAQDRAGSKQNWNHDPQHRKGAGYKDSKVAQRYGATPGSSRVTRDQARGYTGAATRPSAGTGAAGAPRPGTGAAARPQPAQRPSTGAASRPAAKAAPSTRTGQSSGSYSGARNPSLDRASSSRGSASRSSAGLRSSGASRGGGGRGGGRR